MPRLSVYVDQQAHGGAPAVSSAAAAAAAAAPPPPPSPAVSPSALRAAGPAGQQLPAKATQEQQHVAVAAKLQEDYAKRLREHGPRTFRWADGSLRPERPQPQPHTVANRQRWAQLVRHCRTHGGDRAFERQGQSLRHGLGVSHQQHADFLGSIGLETEMDAAGVHRGAVPGLPSPLDEPDHCFNTYYKEGAEAVFKERRGRLL